MGEIGNIAVSLMVLTMVGIGFGYFLLKLQSAQEK
ncbi:MAG: PetM family cytochrome b6-f complex subunit 7 [Pseudanabaenaceae cyanobacterium]